MAENELLCQWLNAVMYSSVDSVVVLKTWLLKYMQWHAVMVYVIVIQYEYITSSRPTI